MRGNSSHRRTARVVAAVLLLLTTMSVCPAVGWADGDPASDVLLGQDVFYPFKPKVSPGQEAALEKTLKAAASAAGLHLKVAIIGAPEELGLVPHFFGHP